MAEKEYISKDYALYLVNYFGNMLTWSKEDIISEIKRKITEEPAADVSPVVRCKDCRSYKLLNGSWRCSYHGVRIYDDNFYCACGKRKELDNGKAR